MWIAAGQTLPRRLESGDDVLGRQGEGRVECLEKHGPSGWERSEQKKASLFNRSGAQCSTFKLGR